MRRDMDADILWVQQWAAGQWAEGCLLGDLARLDVEEMTDDEQYMLFSALEGWLKAGGRIPARIDQ